MKGKPFFLVLFVLCFIVSFSVPGAGADKKSALTVKKIAFTGDENGGEWITLFCNQSCVPELFSIEGENPRVVMDMQGVSLIQSKARNINTGGKLVKNIRSYLNEKTKILRVVLDLEPSKHYMVCPMQDPFNHTYMIRIEESEQKPGESPEDKNATLSQDKRITILLPDLKPEEQQERKPQVAGPSEKKPHSVDAAQDMQTVDLGRSLLNAGEFAAAIETFTRTLAVHPKDSLSYRLRGNAYDNLGHREKAIEDWMQASRLGDAIVQSYLDFLGVKWRENPAP
jgi:tetratricopeptide (TPR) repeat protein